MVKTGSSGASSNAALLNFNSSNPVVALLSGNAISLDGINLQYAFSVPKDCTISEIHTTVGNWGTFTPPEGATVTPYVMLFRAAAGQNQFTALAATKTKSTTGYSGSVPANTMLAASSTPNVPVKAGDRLLICGLAEMTDTVKSGELSHAYYFYFTGGLALS